MERLRLEAKQQIPPGVNRASVTTMTLTQTETVKEELGGGGSRTSRKVKAASREESADLAES